jgi:hypothetical protein
MSSPPMDFPSSDASMDDAEQTFVDAPAAHSLGVPRTPRASQQQQQRVPLFAGTPSAAGTPRPVRTPLFAGGACLTRRLHVGLP